MNDDVYEPAFVIHGKIPERKPSEPPPTPRRQPSDEVLAGNAERVYEYAAARPVFLMENLLANGRFQPCDTRTIRLVVGSWWRIKMMLTSGALKWIAYGQKMFDQ